MKDFFFDGSTGLYQNSDSSKVWIYPSMRRGGKMLYAFNVSPGAPPASVKWKAGCDSSGCTDSKLSNIGQTWSTPNVAFLAGYSTSVPVVVMGGGYDTCEDADSNPSASGFCTSPKGAAVYVFDGDTGTVIASFTTDRSVAGDVTFVDVNLDGNPDLGYVADTGGNIYRINFSDPAKGFTPLSSTSWTITKVAYTHSASRKFLFAPAVLAYKNQVYLALGSGDREHPTAASYPFTMPVTNRFYVYLDDPLRTTVTDLDGANMYNHSDASVDICNYEQVLPGGAKYGWYMDLGQFGKGEQTVTSALINLGRVTFSTNRPFGSTTASCSSPLGEARGYWLNLLNGSGAIDSSGNQAICGVTRSSTFVGGGLPPSPVTGTVTVNDVPQTVVIGAVQADGSVSSPIGGQKAVPPIKPIRKRVYWRTSSDTH
jgi:Tfp pilus tip-associated adhesin PilY1